MKDAKRQQNKILSCVRSHLLYLDKSPTFAEIAKSTGIDMLTAYVAVIVLIKKGLLVRVPHRHSRYLSLPQ